MNEVVAVLDRVELSTGVLDDVIRELVVIGGLDIANVEDTSFGGANELLAVVVSIVALVPVEVVMSFDGTAELPAGMLDVAAEKLLIVVARLGVEADVTVRVLEDGADVTTAAVVGVAAATEGTLLTVIPDKLAHTWTNALPKSLDE
ncbi:hypothetical protein MMC34_005186 [Xylographa carneopallida]|nr:hypothetical protein [Xylographa carneopallida]